jgi:hypothetical protein
MEVAQLGQNLPAAGETIANNLDNMGDAWVRLRASLADTGAIKSATGAIAKLMETTAVFFEKKTELRALEDRALKELGLNRSDITLGDDYSPQEARAYADAVAAVEERKRMIAERDRANALMEKAEKEAGERIARDAAGKKNGIDVSAKIDPSKRWATRSGNVVTLTDEWGQMDAAAAEHSRNIERAEAADKRKMESREQERERLRKEIIRKEKEIQGQEERTEKARQDVEKSIAKAEKKAMDERLDRERDFWKNMRETTSNGLAEILIAEQEGASWWSGIDGMRHRAVKAGITGATKLGINWLAGAAGMAAGGPGGAMLGATGMEFLSSFLGFRAGGGHTMRAQVVGEDRAEVFRPTVPGTIYNNTQSTSYNGGITVILPNARSADDIARDLPRATRSASSNRRQTSR